MRSRLERVGLAAQCDSALLQEVEHGVDGGDHAASERSLAPQDLVGDPARLAQQLGRSDIGSSHGQASLPPGCSGGIRRDPQRSRGNYGHGARADGMAAARRWD
jgi:hypothetical protein